MNVLDVMEMLGDVMADDDAEVVVEVDGRVYRVVGAGVLSEGRVVLDLEEVA